MRMFVFLTLACAPAYANSGWQLNLLVFSSANGHMNGTDSYLAEFRLPAQTADDCNRVGNLALLYFKSGKLADNAVTLAGFSCEQAP